MPHASHLADKYPQNKVQGKGHLVVPASIAACEYSSTCSVVGMEGNACPFRKRFRCFDCLEYCSRVSGTAGVFEANGVKWNLSVKDAIKCLGVKGRIVGAGTAQEGPSV